jgi:hypothetical protein
MLTSLTKVYLGANQKSCWFPVATLLSELDEHAIGFAELAENAHTWHSI